jgi:hypothetical protein
MPGGSMMATSDTRHLTSWMEEGHLANDTIPRYRIAERV